MRRKKITRITIYILIAALTLAGCGKLATPPETQQATQSKPVVINTFGNSFNNINNGLGIATIQGDWIYYVKSAEGTSSTIYKMKSDTTQKTKIYKSSDELTNLNIIGDTLFFVEEKSGSYVSILKISIENDSSPQKLYTLDTKGPLVPNLLIFGDIAYFQTYSGAHSGTLQKLSLKDGKIEPVVKRTSLRSQI